LQGKMVWADKLQWPELKTNCKKMLSKLFKALGLKIQIFLN
jgi:hypothetical protein